MCSRFEVAMAVQATAFWTRCSLFRLDWCSRQDGLTIVKSQWHQGGCHDFGVVYRHAPTPTDVTWGADVVMGCFADVVDMLVKGQRAVYWHIQSLCCCCDWNRSISNLDIADFFLPGLSLAPVSITIASVLSGLRHSPLASSQWCSPADQGLGLEAPRGQKWKSWSWS